MTTSRLQRPITAAEPSAGSGPVSIPVAGPEEVLVHPGDWEPAVADAGGPQLVVGGPGTGKTEFLVRRAAHLLTAGVPADRILVLAFSRRGVADLERRLSAAGAADAPPVAVTTFHGLASGLVEIHHRDRGWNRPPQILTAPEQATLVGAMLGEEDPDDWSVAMRPLLRSTTFTDEVRDFLLRAGEQLAGPDEVAAMDRDDWRGLPGLMARYRHRLVATDRIDYGLVLTEAVAILAHHPIGARYVLVDEYQDTTTAQVALLRALAVDGNVTAAADPYQSIYSFRGASLHNVARFAEVFSSPGRRPRRLVLTTSFRTPTAILRAAERVAGADIPGAASPVAPAPGDGRVDLHRFHQRTAEAEWIAGEIQRLHLRDRTAYRSIAVFVRSRRRFVAELSRALERRGIPHERPGARTADQPEVRFLLDLVAAATLPESPARSRHVRHLLLGPWFGLTLGEAAELDRRRVATATGWADILDARFPELAGLLADPVWAARSPAAVGAWTVWTTLPQIADVATGDHHREARRTWASMLQVLTRWNERNPAATLTDYAVAVEGGQFEARPLVSYADAAGDRVTVTTLHQAKGLEFEVVFIADAVEGVFPDLRAQDSLLGVRHLLPGLPHDPAGYRRFRLQEERRLAYTAMTRASRRVVWTATSTGFDDGHGLPSRFLALAAGTATVEEALEPPDREQLPVTASEAEGLLRRLAADPDARLELDSAATPALRLGGRPLRAAAMAVLAEGTRWGMRPVGRFAGFQARGPDTGLVELPLRLSPSDGEVYEQCPRRFAVERRLRIGEPTTRNAALGSLVHRVLDAVERSALDSGVPHTRADAGVELARCFDGEAFGDEPLATAWRRRAESILDTLYDKWPATGRAVMVERRLELEHAGTMWSGRADRIEDRDGRLVVVDYKTGGMPSRAEVGRSLQLGYYMLAAGADPEVAASGDVAGAEAWYPWQSRRSAALKRPAFDPANLGSVAERMEAIAAGVSAEDWTPRPGDHCDRCAVRFLCPARPEGSGGFAP